VALIDQLRARFREEVVVTGAQVKKFIEDETQFVKKHMTAVLKREEAAGRLIVEPLKTDKTRARPRLTQTKRGCAFWTSELRIAGDALRINAREAFDTYGTSIFN
jgi:hypothetical protein